MEEVSAPTFVTGIDGENVSTFRRRVRESEGPITPPRNGPTTPLGGTRPRDRPAGTPRWSGPCLPDYRAKTGTDGSSVLKTELGKGRAESSKSVKGPGADGCGRDAEALGHFNGPFAATVDGFYDLAMARR